MPSRITIPACPHEPRRLEALRSYAILHTPPEPAFDELARLAARACGASRAAIAFVEDGHVWLKASASGRAPVAAASLALQLVRDGEPRVLAVAGGEGPDAPFLAAAPLISPEGFLLGALCVEDTGFRRMSPELEETLRALARQVMTTLELRRHADEMHRMADALRDARDKVRFLSHYDELTGLPRRNLFTDRVERALANGRRRGTLTAVLAVDVDDLRTVNTALGRKGGDALLKSLAKDLSASLRESDTVARVGGDGFAILCENMQDTVGAAKVAETVTAAGHRTAGRGRLKVAVSVSVGVAVAPGDGNDPETLLVNAGNALRHAREMSGDGAWAVCGETGR